MMVWKRWTPLKHVFFGIYVRFLGDLICIRPKYQNSPEKLEYQRMNQKLTTTFSIVSKCFILKGCFRQGSHLVSFVPNPKGPDWLMIDQSFDLPWSGGIGKGQSHVEGKDVATGGRSCICGRIRAVPWGWKWILLFIFQASLRLTIDQLVEFWIFVYILILAKYLTTVLIHSSQKLFRTA